MASLELGMASDSEKAEEQKHPTMCYVLPGEIGMLRQVMITPTDRGQVVAWCAWRYGSAAAWPTVKLTHKQAWMVLHLPWRWMRRMVGLEGHR